MNCALNMDFDVRFWEIPTKRVTMESLEAFVNDGRTKRLCFAMPMQNKPLSDGCGEVKKWFNLPFRETIGAILKDKVGISILNRKDGSGCCYPCKTDEDIQKIQEFVETHRNLVFLRDTLDMSIALSMRELELESGARTEIGQLEYLVKWEDDVDRTFEKKRLSEALKAVLDDLPYFKEADCICVIPSSKSFMRDIIAPLKGFGNISDDVKWLHKGEAAKDEEDGSAKIRMLESFGLNISPEADIKGKTVLLVDDLYRSGITMQYVALKLKEAGASRVFGIALVKGLRNK